MLSSISGAPLCAATAALARDISAVLALLSEAIVRLFAAICALIAGLLRGPVLARAAARASVSASGAGSTVERTQVGVNYRHTLSERMTFLWNGSYSRSEGQAGLLGTRQFVSGRGGLEYQLQRGLKIGAEGYYRDIYGQGFPVKADIGGDIYATIQLVKR